MNKTNAIHKPNDPSRLTAPVKNDLGCCAYRGHA